MAAPSTIPASIARKLGIVPPKKDRHTLEREAKKAKTAARRYAQNAQKKKGG